LATAGAVVTVEGSPTPSAGWSGRRKTSGSGIPSSEIRQYNAGNFSRVEHLEDENRKNRLSLGRAGRFVFERLGPS
jgi:hypothetical protein